MGNVGLSPGYCTRIWRIEWEEEEEAGGNGNGADEVKGEGGDGGSGRDDDGGERMTRNSSSGADEEGIRMREEERKKWCRKIAACDSEKKLYHWIVCRHYESGRATVFVDGMFQLEGHASFSSCKLLPFKVGGKLISINIGFNEGSNFAYSYQASIVEPNGNQIILKELNQILMQNHDPTILQGSVLSAAVERQAPKPGQGVGKPVAIYEIASCVRDGETIKVKKRFSEFVDMDRLVRSAFQGSHLLSSLPQLPAKQSKVLANHLDPAFIEKRRSLLDAYLRKLLMLPRIPMNPDVLEFLGILPSMVASTAPPIVNV